MSAFRGLPRDCDSAAGLDALRAVLDLAEREADRLTRDRGSWQPRPKGP